MAKDDKKTKAEPAATSEAAAKIETPSSKETTKAVGSETAAAPANYSRGEGQKPVTAAYKENWNAIFEKKKAKKKPR